MPSVNDVAAAILEETGPIDTFKLQKLVYYSQAWHLVWNDEPLFAEPIEAWAGGPVVRSLYDGHRGSYAVSGWKWGDPTRLSKSERETVRIIVRTYGRLSGRQLSTLTHSESPWRTARGELGPGDRGNRVIDLDEIKDYYAALDQADDATPIESFTPSFP